jgi:hypothetical protein
LTFGGSSAFLVDGNKIVQHLSQAITDQLHGPLLIQHWHQKEKFGAGNSTQVDWLALDRSMSNLAFPPSQIGFEV